jgi:hypothetical protein
MSPSPFYAAKNVGTRVHEHVVLPQAEQEVDVPPLLLPSESAILTMSLDPSLGFVCWKNAFQGCFRSELRPPAVVLIESTPVLPSSSLATMMTGWCFRIQFAARSCVRILGEWLASKKWKAWLCCFTWGSIKGLIS